MMKTFNRTEFLSAKNPNLLQDSGFRERKNDLKLLNRRKIRNPGFSGAGIRLKKDGTIGGKRSGPATPLLKWKLDEKDVSVSDDKMPESGKNKGRRKVSSVSARKLAGGLWKLQQPEVNGGGEEVRSSQKKFSDRLGFEPGVGHVGSPFFFHCKNGEVGSETKDLSQSPFCVSTPKNGNPYKVQPPLSFSNSAMEGATKWDPGCSKTSDEVYRFYGQVKLLEDRQTATISVVSSLQSELEQARSRIHELEMERQSSKKQYDHFLRNLKEEKASWRSREHEKVRAIIDDVKDELNREKKNRQRMEIVNSKLVNELANTKRSAKQLMQEYEKERKNRELMEEVCDELAKEIGEDKAEVEVLKRESMNMRSEVDAERKMLQMAEVWREERVQMKLIDAKLILEKKYSQLNKLIADLDAFLRSRTGNTDSVETREAELLREAASSVNIHDVKFSYEPPNSEDIFSVFEDLQPGGMNEREIEQCLDFSPEVNGFKRNSVGRYSNGFIDHHGEIEEDGSGWETVSHVEDQGSSYSPEGSELSVDRSRRDSNASVSVTGWEENAGQESPNTETSEICSVSTKQSKKKASSISRLWRSNPSNSEKYKIISVEGRNERLSNGRMPNGGINSPDRRSGEGGFSSPSLVSLQWSSPDSGNPQTKGMKGCIEWKRANHRNSLKAKLLEARLESQKYQLRHVLKQKI
ncbi:hypothetical protein BVC80_8987g17 [Macleaya cordata]|uniref:Uncharacterized protein n=1 Tax=Macleaya cordata TaxID=56857 RepID=A0A200QJD3_MACCD|nr:hypothetical protein BVC80_8987g17 [Macleaya cordata]